MYEDCGTISGHSGHSNEMFEKSSETVRKSCVRSWKHVGAVGMCWEVVEQSTKIAEHISIKKNLEKA